VKKSFTVFAFFLLAAIFLAGCVGTYNNSDNFLNPPAIGSEEIAVQKNWARRHSLLQPKTKRCMCIKFGTLNISSSSDFMKDTI